MELLEQGPQQHQGDVVTRTDAGRAVVDLGIECRRDREQVVQSGEDACTGSTNAWPIGVSSSARPLRTNSGSPNNRRSRASAALIAGWRIPRVSAARVT
jgi:hypothetical protein